MEGTFRMLELIETVCQVAAEPGHGGLGAVALCKRKPVAYLASSSARTPWLYRRTLPGRCNFGDRKGRGNRAKTT